MLTCIAAFGSVVYLLAPSKPTTVMNYNWQAVDRDFGGHLGFATGKTTKTFRD